MIRLFTAVVFTALISFPLFCQEICNNGIDDDGNGLVDNLDPACLSCGVTFKTFKEDFEDYSCCPAGLAQFNCLNGGWVATSSSPDYFNTCDYIGGVIRPEVPFPIPSGEGVAGLGTFNESIGSCLDNALIAGETYNISFNVGFNDIPTMGSELNVEFTLYGMGCCVDELPPTEDAPTCNNSEWFEIANFNVIGLQDSSWTLFSSTFSTNFITNSIAIGHSCAFTTSVPQNNFHFLDDIEISGNFGLTICNIPEISFSEGGSCIDGYSLEVDDTNAISYQWYLDGVAIPGATSNPYQIDVTQSGMYQVAVLDDLGCNLISDPFDVDIELEVLDIIGEVIHLDCFLFPTGSIDIDVDQTNTSLSYLWSNGETTEDIQNLATGTYSVTVTHINGCFGIMDFEVEGPDEFINTLVVVQPDMGNLGSATITTIGGVEPYTYEWSNGNTSNFDIDLMAGFYSVTVTDANGCEEIFEFEIITAFSVNSSFTDVSCFGSCDGSISLEVDGPDLVYTVNWYDSDLEGFMPNNVCAGTYNYIVVDENFLSFGGSITISQPDEIIITADYTEFFCDTFNETNIALDVSGGAFPYTYSWTDGSINDTLFNAGFGSHTVNVTDSDGCTEDSTFIVDTFPAFNLSLIPSLTGCNGEHDGNIDLSISGGLAPFMYLWSNGSITEDLIDLAPGIYSVTVTDANNCTSIDSVDVHQNPGVEVNDSYSNINCPDLDDGSIYLDIIGESSEYDIVWSTGSDSSYVFDLSPGNYSVTITTINGCIWNQSYDLTLNSDLIITAEVKDNLCFQEQEGSINMQIDNSTSPYNISWSNGSIDEDLTNISAGLYEFSLIDSFGCEYNYSYNVEEGLEMLYSTNVTEPGCDGTSVDSIKITPSAGSMPFSYLWSTGNTTSLISDLEAGVYFVTITDNEGCIKLDTFLILENSNPRSK